MNEKVYKEMIESAIKEIERLPLHRLDSNSELLKEAFDIFYRRDIFTLYKIDTALHNRYKFILFSTLTKYSGSLAFLAIQILAGNAIMLANSFPKRELYFSKKCGIAINHLRAPITIVSAAKCEGGYRLKGKLSWASGYKIFDTLLIGFHHNGREYEAMAEFKNSKNFVIGDVAESFVGNSMATVNIELEDFFVKDEDIISSKIMGNYTKAKSISKTVHFALYGLGLGAVETLVDEKVKSIATQRLESIKERFLSTEDGEKMDKIRIELFELIQSVVTTGMVLYGGKSILIEEKMQRYYRELIMFNSNGLNGKIKELFQESFTKEWVNR
jgi:hypothetical protein